MIKTFIVGGAVRDTLMGRTVRDRDYVVVGTTPEQMLALGFRLVGADFPVFLHPDTGEEYALARTERKSGPGYQGFAVHAAPDVTIEEDLSRRDLTVNAMAMANDGTVIDPYGGKADLAAKVFRHVSANAFAEDPVRVLRLARFAARHRDFSIAPETLALASATVHAGDLAHVVAERVWQELAKGIMEDKPSRMFDVLREVGALKVILPELDALWGVPQPPAHHPEVDTGVHVMMALDTAAAARASLEVRFAVLLHDLGKAVTPADQWPSHHKHEYLGLAPIKAVCARWRVPSACRELALLVCREHTLVHSVARLREATVVELFRRADAFRRPERFAGLLIASECDARGRLGLEDRAYPQAAQLRTDLVAALAVDAGAVARECKKTKHIPDTLHAARVSAVKAARAVSATQ